MVHQPIEPAQPVRYPEFAAIEHEPRDPARVLPVPALQQLRFADRVQWRRVRPKTNAISDEFLAYNNAICDGQGETVALPKKEGGEREEDGSGQCHLPSAEGCYQENERAENDWARKISEPLIGGRRERRDALRYLDLLP